MSQHSLDASVADTSEVRDCAKTADVRHAYAVINLLREIADLAKDAPPN
jgi:hypothetical protein